MKLHTLIALVTVSFSGAALAEEFDQGWFTKVTPHHSRAEVRADLAANGPLAVGEAGYHFATENFVATKTRAQVLAEAREALRLGLVRGGEGSIPTASPEQERLIALAGQRALQGATVAAVN